MLKYFVAVLLVLGTMVSFTEVGFAADEFVAGTDYIIIKDNDKPAPLKNTVNVTEFFSYGCPWCYKVEPTINQWVAQQGNKVAFKKVPVIFNKDWEYYAKAYYTVNALSLGEKLNPILFKAILTDKKSLNSNDAMINFLIEQGADAATVRSAFESSPTIDLDINAGKRQMAQYQINAVPALLVNNKYKTDLQMAKTEERLIAILNFLVKKAGSEKA